MSAVNDPASAKMVFSISSLGYTTAGVATTTTRTVYGTKRIRKAYPDHADANESVAAGTLTIKVALSDFIYASDTAITATLASGVYTKTAVPNNTATAVAVTNNSTLAYPKVVGRWAWPGYERVTADFLVEAAVFNRFGQNGSPVAAVIFTASDTHGNSVSQTASAMTKTTRTGDANQVLVYAATMPVASLTQGDIITVQFVAYPWVGGSDATLNTSVLADGYAQPNERLGPLTALNDKSGTYGVGYAHVASGGNDTTGTVYSSAAAAEAGSSYLTIEKAAQGLRTYHNANHSRDNAGGGTVLLAEGSYTFPGASVVSKGASMDTWLTIKPASTASRANTILSASGGAVTFNATRLKVEGLTASSTDGFMFGARLGTDVLWLHGNSLNLSGLEPTYYWSPAYATQNQITSLTNGFSHQGVDDNPWALVRGNTATTIIRASLYAMLGNAQVQPFFLEATNAPGQQISDNAVFAFNTLKSWSGPSTMAYGTTITRGVAYVQNLIETIDAAQPLLQIADNGTPVASTTNNIILWHNTFAGQRVNLGYNDDGSVAADRLNWSDKFNIFEDWNTKGDAYTGNSGGNGARTGNWPISYNLGSVGNAYRASNFPGEFDGLAFNLAGNPQFTSDLSARNAGAGGGTYTIASSSAVIDIKGAVSASDLLLPYDLAGNVRYGFPDSGAYEYISPFTMGSDEVSTVVTARVYGNEKFRNKTAPASATTADLSISLPGTNTSEWLDIAISTWNTSGTYQKVWTENSSSTALANTVHIVGDLAASTSYAVSVDSVAGASITGADCTSGVCVSDANGRITFTYTGSYSSHTFDVSTWVDTTAPSITLTAPVDGATISSATVNLTESSSDNVSVSGVQFKVNTSTLIGAEDTSAPYAVSWDLSSVANGSYSLIAVARDAAGNYTTSTAVSVTVSIAAAASATSAGGGYGGSPWLSDPTPPLITLTSSGGYTATSSLASSTPPLAAPPPGTTNPYRFIRNLSFGDRRSEVKKLQQFLNTQLAPIALGTSPGATGFETNYYGPATRAAVAAYQKANGITPAVGYFGPITRKKINQN
jgi:hypothetical protein